MYSNNTNRARNHNIKQRRLPLEPESQEDPLDYSEESGSSNGDHEYQPVLAGINAQIRMLSNTVF
jgi:hypothetical protein